MNSIRNQLELKDIGEAARRQYIDARSLFTALEETERQSSKYRGGMYWKKHARTGIEYLMRTQPDNSQASLGPRSSEAEITYESFTVGKEEHVSRLQDLKAEIDVQQRVNRALNVGRAPQFLVDILTAFDRAGISEHFRVVGTHALYAYEAAAGVRIERRAALETRDVDLLWAIGKKIKFQARLKHSATSLIDLLRKVDKTFQVREDQRYTAVNSKGFEVDILRPFVPEDEQDVPKENPSRMTDAEGDLLAIKASTGSILQGAAPFDAVIVSTAGRMARIHTITPLEFVRVKRWLAESPERDTMKKGRDALQADIVEKMVQEYLPHLAVPKNSSPLIQP